MLRRFGVNYAVFSLAMDAITVLFSLAVGDHYRSDLQWLPFSQHVVPNDNVPAFLYLAAPLLWAAVLFLFSLYDPRAIFKASDEFRILLLGSAFAGLATAGLLYVSYRGVSRWLFILFVTTTLLLLSTWRAVARLIVARRRKPVARPRPVLVVGAHEVGKLVGRLINDHQWAGLTLEGYIDDDPSNHTSAAPILGRIADTRAIVQATKARDVVVALPYGDSRLESVVKSLLDMPVHVRVVPSMFTLALDTATIENFAGVPMIDLRAGPLNDYQRVTKRILDLAVSAPLFLTALPVMALVAIVIKLDSPGPILFRQQRVGENGATFTMYKFRSMVQDAESLQPRINGRDAAGRVIHKRQDDPRVTRIGHFIRQTSLDELPQLFNVLKGDMSLVGPRPELPWLVAQYEPWQRRRLVVPQGLTGWWQINGRSAKPMHLHTDEDIHYITNYSFWLDLQILWRTVWAVLQRRGAV